MIIVSFSLQVCQHSLVKSLFSLSAVKRDMPKRQIQIIISIPLFWKLTILFRLHKIFLLNLNSDLKIVHLLAPGLFCVFSKS